MVGVSPQNLFPFYPILQVASTENVQFSQKSKHNKNYTKQ